MTILINTPDTLDTRTFRKFKDLIYDKSGITLNDKKLTLVQSRISKRVRQLELDSYDKYFEYIIKDTTGLELSNLIDAISTNVTKFFRENDHLKALEDIMEERSRLGRSKYRLWSAACSSGEEPYSMAISTMEALTRKSVDLRILATDISTIILEKAKKGTYTAKQLETVPATRRERYFKSTGYGNDAVYEVKDPMKRLISFARINLAAPPFPMKGPFDVIFCRNVMIYFDAAVKRRLLLEFHRLLADDGYMMLGMSESITGLDVPFRAVAASMYVKD